MTPTPQIQPNADGTTLRLAGAWVTARLSGLDAAIEGVASSAGGPVIVDGGAISAFDTGGAWYLRRLVTRLREAGSAVAVTGLRDEFGELYTLVSERLEGVEKTAPPPAHGWFERIGRETVSKGVQGYRLLAFIGEATVALLQVVRHPARLRWRSLLAEIETAGFNALPIIGLLSFLIGIVIAYQGGVQLSSYGANIFVVELVSLTILRELAPVMTAVIVAGRTGSAYTAQIGTMLVNDEIDALRTMGIPPLELLVLPKLLGLMIALPLLTMFADMLGILGGMVMSAMMLDVSMTEFLLRIPQKVSVTSFMIGIGKTPIFALLIAMVGCYQGMQVVGGADSVGRQTTVSVVQGIFLVIVADAIFSIVFSWLKI